MMRLLTIIAILALAAHTVLGQPRDIMSVAHLTNGAPATLVQYSAFRIDIAPSSPFNATAQHYVPCSPCPSPGNPAPCPICKFSSLSCCATQRTAPVIAFPSDESQPGLAVFTGPDQDGTDTEFFATLQCDKQDSVCTVQGALNTEPLGPGTKPLKIFAGSLNPTLSHSTKCGSSGKPCFVTTAPLDGDGGDSGGPLWVHAIRVAPATGVLETETLFQLGVMPDGVGCTGPERPPYSNNSKANCAFGFFDFAKNQVYSVHTDPKNASCTFATCDAIITGQDMETGKVALSVPIGNMRVQGWFGGLALDPPNHRGFWVVPSVYGVIDTTFEFQLWSFGKGGNAKKLGAIPQANQGQGDGSPLAGTPSVGQVVFDSSTQTLSFTNTRVCVWRPAVYALVCSPIFLYKVSISKDGSFVKLLSTTKIPDAMNVYMAGTSYPSPWTPPATCSHQNIPCGQKWDSPCCNGLTCKQDDNSYYICQNLTNASSTQ